jgi:hypothetical protein
LQTYSFGSTGGVLATDIPVRIGVADGSVPKIGRQIEKPFVVWRNWTWRNWCGNHHDSVLAEWIVGVAL